MVKCAIPAQPSGAKGCRLAGLKEGIPEIMK